MSLPILHSNVGLYPNLIVFADCANALGQTISSQLFDLSLSQPTREVENTIPIPPFVEWVGALDMCVTKPVLNSLVSKTWSRAVQGKTNILMTESGSTQVLYSILIIGE